MWPRSGAIYESVNYNSKYIPCVLYCVYLLISANISLITALSSTDGSKVHVCIT